jgi:hypothetical protein
MPTGLGLLAGGLAVATLAGGVVDGGSSAEARSILLAAAATAQSEPFVPPDPAAFVYTRTKEEGRGFSTTREAWLSVDGTRPGALTPSGSTGLVEIPAVDARPAYGADLPTTAAAMRDHLYRDSAERDSAHSADYTAFQEGMALAQETLLPPAVRAALFEAMARIPDVELVRGAENVAGRRGVAVAFREGGHRDELLFDPVTHQVIGRRSVWLGRPARLVPDTVEFSAAVLESGVVDRVRLRPDGSVREGRIEVDDGLPK